MWAIVTHNTHLQSEMSKCLRFALQLSFRRRHCLNLRWRLLAQVWWWSDLIHGQSGSTARSLSDRGSQPVMTMPFPACTHILGNIPQTLAMSTLTILNILNNLYLIFWHKMNRDKSFESSCHSLKHHSLNPKYKSSLKSYIFSQFFSVHISVGGDGGRLIASWCYSFTCAGN